MRWMIITSAAAAAAVIGTTAAVARDDSRTTVFRTTLLGANERPVPGDPDGSGTAQIRIKVSRGELCYNLRVRGIEPATAAHIHEAPSTTAGPVVQGLTAPTGGSSRGCVFIGREQAQEIIDDPENYYVNVHNAPFPGGALRGQLG